MVAERGRGDAGTATRILDVAERLAQVRGFNGFSYADIAAELGITKAALHYHFATKADLGEALISRYAARFGEALAAIDAGTAAAPAKLQGYAELYADVLRNQRMCLCGMLAAEYPTLPGAMQASVVSFFDQNEAWLQDVLQQGRADGSLHFTGPGPRRRPHDHQLPRRRHARHQALRRHPAIPARRGQPHHRPHLTHSHPGLTSRSTGADARPGPARGGETAAAGPR